MKEFSERLVQLRRERQMTQLDLAKLTKKQRSTISGYETEGKEPDLALLCSMADLFGVTTDYLLGRDKDQTHAETVFRTDNAAFKKRFDVLPADQKALVTSAFDSFYVLLSRCMDGKGAAELSLYRDFMDSLQKERAGIKNLVRSGSEQIGVVFPRLMERQNTLKASLSSILDSLMQVDLAAAFRR